ncbi:MAG: RNA methyltransferase [Planctomycetota bacterium]
MPDRHAPSDPTTDLFSTVRSLARRSTRDKTGRYWFEGVRHFVQACDAGTRLEAVVTCPKLLKSHVAEVLIRRAKQRGVPVRRVGPEQFREVSTADRACGVGAIAVPHWTPLDRADPAAGVGWLVIEHVRSPGNLGTILRTAEAVGVGGVVFAGPSCDPFAAATVRASMGGLFPLRLCRASHAAVADWAAAAGMTLVGLSPDATTRWDRLADAAPPGRPVAVVLGGERRGLSERSRSLCDVSVSLPMSGTADSLNVSVAAGVMLYELQRRGT